MKFLLFLFCAGLAAAGQIPPTSKPIHLFNGKTLDGFDVYLDKRQLNEDPNRVFTARDGMIRASGAEYGYLITRGEYDNYYLKLEFKWGTETHAPRAGNARDSGVLFHVAGPDKVWPKSIEFQMIEGGTGDIILVGGASLTVKGQTRDRGRFDRFGKGAWKDTVGYRDPNGDVEKPHGQWNKLELLAAGDSVHYWVNGKLVNEGTGASPTRGKILLQSEGAEVFFRKIELRPLKQAAPREVSRR
ncbi:MAG: DUF1080 domain-containing protein [Acidobacteria bacterium]|nr:DUF1080 domain-containing protein [Acidobacteriota bacterium]MBI3281737.1 DUF1080 domain-containing protein [Acidobacteriota bacterium]